jgi:ketosteroid isomerase-like protein
VTDLESQVRAVYERFNHDDVEGAVQVFGPDIVVIDAPQLPDSQTYRGRAAVAEALRGLREMFDAAVEVQDLRVRGDRALALIHARGRGTAGGVPIETPIAHVFTVRDGAIAEMRVFLSHDDGVAAFESG